MNKEEKQLKTFISEAESVAREWVVASVGNQSTHPSFTNRISTICSLAKTVLNEKDDEESD